MKHKLFKYALGAIFLLIVLFLVFRLDPPVDTRVLAQGDRPECPHDWDDVLRERADRRHGALNLARSDRFIPNPVAASVTTYMISGEITNVPEFHDCQRLISTVAGKPTYAQLAAIFARDSIDSVIATPGRVVAAEVFSEGAFPTLGIHPGFHCLVLEPDSNRAFMVALGKSHAGSSCKALDLNNLPRGMPAYELALERHRPMTAPPPVARWIWDDSVGQVIGIKCTRTQWCTIGPAGFTVRAVDGLAPGVMQVPGWFDDQYIADYPTSGITPGKSFGRVYPVENLGDLNWPNDFLDWTLVAHVELPAGFPETYTSKLGFMATSIATSSLAGLNQLFLCNGTANKCGIKKADLGQVHGGCSQASWNGDVMWAKVVSATGERPVFHCVARRTMMTTVSHEAIKIPGVARWRWRADDETIWVRCGAGCCEVHAGV